jgi:hypothetical protein
VGFLLELGQINNTLKAVMSVRTRSLNKVQIGDLTHAQFAAHRFWVRSSSSRWPWNTDAYGFLTGYGLSHNRHASEVSDQVTHAVGAKLTTQKITPRGTLFNLTGHRTSTSLSASALGTTLCIKRDLDCG